MKILEGQTQNVKQSSQSEQSLTFFYYWYFGLFQNYSILDTIITCDRKKEAKRKALIKDEKYAPFREYFKNLQYKKFISYQKQGKNLSASAFVRYFLKSKAHVVDIPYKNSNWEIKLNQLAQANNREFKKSSCMM